jgi:hypothetical protein
MAFEGCFETCFEACFLPEELSQELHPMRWLLAVALVSFSLPANAGNLPGSGMRGLTGNDSGGIIQWTPEIDHVYRDIAADHCARWHRFAQITSVHRRYGDFIGFRCLYDRDYDPRKARLEGTWFRGIW